MASIAKIQHSDTKCKKIAKFNWVVAFRICNFSCKPFYVFYHSPTPTILSLCLRRMMAD